MHPHSSFIIRRSSFVIHNQSDTTVPPSFIRSRSGHPGYLPGLPVVAASTTSVNSLYVHCKQRDKETERSKKRGRRPTTQHRSPYFLDSFDLTVIVLLLRHVCQPVVVASTTSINSLYVSVALRSRREKETEKRGERDNEAHGKPGDTERGRARRDCPCFLDGSDLLHVCLTLVCLLFIQFAEGKESSVPFPSLTLFVDCPC